jgi:hypothetical protein
MAKPKQHENHKKPVSKSIRPAWMAPAAIVLIIVVVIVSLLFVPSGPAYSNNVIVKVTGTDALPISDASVVATRIGPNLAGLNSIEVLTGTDGYGFVGELPVGNYSLKISKEGYVDSFEKSIEVTRDSVNEFQFTLFRINES